MSIVTATCEAMRQRAGRDPPVVRWHGTATASAFPLPYRVVCAKWRWALLHRPLVAIVEQKIPRGTEGVLAQGALGFPGCFAAFAELLAVTMRASDRDTWQGPRLAVGR
jgi:hypothetical protein